MSNANPIIDIGQRVPYEMATAAEHAERVMEHVARQLLNEQPHTKTGYAMELLEAAERLRKARTNQ